MSTATVQTAAPRLAISGPPTIPIMQPIPIVPQPQPTSFADGSLLKGSGPQIYMMENHQLRLIPDMQTFNYMGLNANAVQTVTSAVLSSIPTGPPFPSRADGTLLKGSGPAIYVMQGGDRHWIPDPATFNALGYSWGNVQTVADADLNAIPLGTQVPEGGKVIVPQFPITVSRFDSFSGCGGHMNSTATIYATGLLNVVTRTWEDTELRGFAGAVAVSVLDQNQNSLWVSATQKYGVDGTWVGTSDRTDNWSDSVPAEILPNVRFVAIIQQWDQNNVFDDIEAWLSGTATAAGYVKTIATAIGTIVELF